MTDQNPHNSCLNCGKDVIDLYCHHCGQKQGIARLTWKTIFVEIQKRLFGFDNNFFRTVRDLTIAPGKVVRSSLEGIRVIYIGPVGYFFLLLTIMVLTISFLDIEWSKYVSSTQEVLSPDEITEGQRKFQIDSQKLVEDNLRIVSFLFIPIYALSTKWLFKKSGYNFLEHMVVVFYAQAHPLLLGIISLVIFKISGISLASWLLPVGFAYTAYVCTGVYTYNKKWAAFIKGLLVIPLALLMVIVFSMLVILVLLFTVPEVAEYFKP